ncbi:alpha/beta hydrolase [Rhodoferax koreense]|uniref:Alpha/beta hydrolase n=1 Tax=Rhodoferax koreensis TaxID=1842727 RepID=A0A1P8K3K2_9BURK|nr:alpha/beta hydrolase [Rhodoferax koreense]APW40582.1 alpha/beta hydrolase [Rhodoferax koreense]
MYTTRRNFRSEYVPVRQHTYHAYVWGEPRPGVPPLVMVHGWMDVGASYQFVVDALAADRHVIAPDWRGFGLTTGPAVDNYWFPDYLADLDFLLDHYAGDTPVDLVGHSMGGNVVMQYAGVRPERIRRLVNLEGFGGPQNRAAQAPGRYARWIDELKAFHRGDKALKGYPDADGVARRLMKTNPRLAPDRAAWLARHWARPDAQGNWQILGDPAHKIVFAQLTRLDEVLAMYQRIQAPTLAVDAADDTFARYWPGQYSLPEFHERLKLVPNVRTVTLPDTGHMLHHDQPEALARLIEDFLQA